MHRGKENQDPVTVALSSSCVAWAVPFPTDLRVLHPKCDGSELEVSRSPPPALPAWPISTALLESSRGTLPCSVATVPVPWERLTHWTCGFSCLQDAGDQGGDVVSLAILSMPSP